MFTANAMSVLLFSIAVLSMANAMSVLLFPIAVLSMAKQQPLRFCGFNPVTEFISSSVKPMMRRSLSDRQPTFALKGASGCVDRYCPV